MPPVTRRHRSRGRSRAARFPPGLTLFPNGQMFGTPTATGTFTFTVKVTDPSGKTATRDFSLVISPQPPPITAQQQQCQHAPGSTTANLAGPAIGGKVPSGQGIGDQSQLTACGGFTVIRVSVKNVNLPNGTPLWVTLGGGQVIGRIVLNGGSATMSPWTLAISTLRKQSIQIYTQPPSGNTLRVPRSLRRVRLAPHTGGRRHGGPRPPAPRAPPKRS